MPLRATEAADGSDDLKIVGAELSHGAAHEQHAVALTQIQLSATRCRAQRCQWVEARIEADQLDNVFGWIEVGDGVVAVASVRGR